MWRSAARYIPRTEKISQWANIASGLATAGAAGLAFYAFFGTNLAEEITKQLNAEVAALNEEKIDLLRSRRDLESQVVSVQNDKAKSVEESAKLKESIKALEQDKDTTLAQIKGLQDQQAQLVVENEVLAQNLSQQEKALAAARLDLGKTIEENHEAFVELAVNNIEFHAAWGPITGPIPLDDMKTEALVARDIKLYKEWRKKLDAIKEPVNPTQEQYDEYAREWSKVNDEMPEGWKRWGYVEQRRNEDKATEKMDAVAALRQRLAKKNRQLTGLQYLTSKLLFEGVSYIKFSAPNDKKVRDAIFHYLKSHSELLKGDIFVVQPEGASDEQVKASAEEVLKTIDGIEKLLKAMPEDMRVILLKSR